MVLEAADTLNKQQTPNLKFLNFWFRIRELACHAII
jgi:hypothetical protein